MAKTVAIILAGGSGTRFWPYSRDAYPKQLLALYSDKSLLLETINRTQDMVDEIYISTGNHLKEAIGGAFPEIPLLVEPEKRDTAAAMGFCATQFADEDILIFLPSDHYIETKEQFESTIKKAINKAREKNAITVVAIKPTFPSTGYGYLQPETEEKLAGFTEKPDKKTAKKLVERGYFWNAGMFVTTAKALLEEFRTQAPDIYTELDAIRKGEDLQTHFSKIRKISLDYAVMEGAKEIYYVLAEFSWNDLGSFDALEDIKEQKEGNTSVGATLITQDSKGNIVVGKKTIALLDCQDLVVVDTEDALLICPKSSVEKVKQIREKVAFELK